MPAGDDLRHQPKRQGPVQSIQGQSNYRQPAFKSDGFQPSKCNYHSIKCSYSLNQCYGSQHDTKRHAHAIKQSKRLYGRKVEGIFREGLRHVSTGTWDFRLGLGIFVGVFGSGHSLHKSFVVRSRVVQPIICTTTLYISAQKIFLFFILRLKIEGESNFAVTCEGLMHDSEERACAGYREASGKKEFSGSKYRFRSDRHTYGGSLYAMLTNRCVQE